MIRLGQVGVIDARHKIVQHCISKHWPAYRYRFRFIVSVTALEDEDVTLPVEKMTSAHLTFE